MVLRDPCSCGPSLWHAVNGALAAANDIRGHEIVAIGLGVAGAAASVAAAPLSAEKGVWTIADSRENPVQEEAERPTNLILYKIQDNLTT